MVEKPPTKDSLDGEFCVETYTKDQGVIVIAYTTDTVISRAYSH